METRRRTVQEVILENQDFRHFEADLDKATQAIYEFVADWGDSIPEVDQNSHLMEYGRENEIDGLCSYDRLMVAELAAETLVIVVEACRKAFDDGRLRPFRRLAAV